ncbi:MAG: ROK family protein [Firmicutes bacterium]|nr:ROK family protein [Bacillota bacterium]
MAYSIGVDIGGTKIAAALVQPTGELADLRIVQTPSCGRPGILAEVRELVRELCATGREMCGASPIGVGIGTAGQVDPVRGVVVSGTDAIDDWFDVPLCADIGVASQLPVWIDNDVNAMLLAESIAGAALGHAHALCLALGTGVGGAAMIEGKLLHGASGAAAELGHVSVNMRGPRCSCGQRGCLETYASGRGMVQRWQDRLRERLPDGCDAQTPLPTPEEIVRRMFAGDHDAGAVVDALLEALATGIVGAVHTFNPTIVVLSGGIVDRNSWICTEVRERVRSRGLRSLVAPVEIVRAALGRSSGVVGAGLLAWQEWQYGGSHT